MACPGGQKEPLFFSEAFPFELSSTITSGPDTVIEGPLNVHPVNKINVASEAIIDILIFIPISV
ncbi:hypothetical protein MT391_00835 [Vibrio sp. 1-Bac 57]